MIYKIVHEVLSYPLLGGEYDELLAQSVEDFYTFVVTLQSYVKRWQVQLHSIFLFASLIFCKFTKKFITVISYGSGIVGSYI
jgi:hypothetical protein